MTYLSEKLDIGERYSRGEISDLLGNKKCPKDRIEHGVFFPGNVSSVLVFSTIHNYLNCPNYQKDDNHYVYTWKESDLKTNKEILLFIRISDVTNFVYFGVCKFLRVVGNFSDLQRCELELEVPFIKTLNQMTDSEKKEFLTAGFN